MNDAEPTSQASPGGLFSLVVTRPVAVTMVFLAALVFGFVSYNRLPVELMPDISFPTITVRTAFEGAAPQEVEDQVSEPLESALATLDGLVSLESRSRAGQSDVVLGFNWGTDMAASAQSVRESLQTTFLPDGTERPLILRYDPSLEPFLRLALAGGEDGVSPDEQLFALRQIADKELKRELESMEGVAAARVRGGLEREIRVAVRENWLAARGVRLDEVQALLAAENVNLAGGSILEGDTEYLVRTLNEYKTVEELRTLDVRRSDGVLIPLTDLAVIEEVPRERTVLSRLDGQEAVEIEIFKEADANVVEVARRVKTELFGATMGAAPPAGEGQETEDSRRGDAKNTALAATLPDGVSLEVLDDQAQFIELAISNLTSAVGLGGLFAVFVLYLFLRDARATTIIGLSIPVSVVVGFAPLYLWGVSLNLMSLGGLALGVGMLVDNAVVVLEAIQRHLEEGTPRREAAVRGAEEVAAAVVASTLTTVAVFAPIAFVEGVAGELFGDLALAVVGSLLASLAVAVFLVPMMAALEFGGGVASRVPRWAGFRAVGSSIVHAPWAGLQGSLAWMRERGVRWAVLPYALVRFGLYVLARSAVVGAWYLGGGLLWGASTVWYLAARVIGVPLVAAADVFQRGYAVVAARYPSVAARALSRPGLVAGLAGLAFLGSVQATGWLGSELLPEVHQGRFTVRLAMPVGTPLEETSRVVMQAEQVVSSHPEVASVFGAVGADDRADVGSDEGEHTARLRVTLTPGGNLAAREDRTMEGLRQALAVLEPVKVKMERPSLFSVRTPVEVVIYGEDLDALRTSGEWAVERLSSVPGLRDVRTSLLDGTPEVQIAYDRDRLVRFGLDTYTVATRVRDKIQGVEATRITRGAERLSLRVQLEERERSSLQGLRNLNVNPNVDPPVPLETVADFVEAVGPSEIRRVDQQRAVVISANVKGFDIGTASAAVSAAMADLDLPDGQRWTLGGQADEMSSSLGSLQLALGLAVFLVYVIMASTFEHLLHPFVILLSVPLAVIGVVLGLWPTGQPLSVVVFIGLIVLAGVVVNNAIVLVDAVSRLRAEGTPRLQAIAEAGSLRLRPILITTSTTVLGLLPLAFGFGAGAEVQRPLAVTVIGGLSVATLLTLLVIPAVYALLTGIELRTSGEPQA